MLQCFRFRKKSCATRFGRSSCGTSDPPWNHGLYISPESATILAGDLRIHQLKNLRFNVQTRLWKEHQTGVTLRHTLSYGYGKNSWSIYWYMTGLEHLTGVTITSAYGKNSWMYSCGYDPLDIRFRRPSWYFTFVDSGRNRGRFPDEIPIEKSGQARSDVRKLRVKKIAQFPGSNSCYSVFSG